MEDIERYTTKSEGISIPVTIKGYKDRGLLYQLRLPTFGTATNALVDEIRTKLIIEVTITTAEILDPKVVSELKAKFRKKAEGLIAERLPGAKPSLITYLVGTLLHEMLGLGEIEFLMEDPFLEEIVILSAGETVRVYHKKYGWLNTNIVISSEEKIQNYSTIIARRIGRQITTLNPLLDAHLITGDRANAVLYPISTKGNTVTIRKFARDPWTVTDFIKSKTCNSGVFALIWFAVQFEANMLISGGTASGKTSLLNVIMPFIPPNHRIISIEDTRELQVAEHLYWCPLTVRQPNPEGKGEVTMLDLLVNSLRMRPDRIILGEIRKKDQALVLFEAMHTGHSVYATVHANTAHETVTRLIHPPIEIPPNLLGAVNLNLVMFRDRRQGIRRLSQVAEFVTGEEAEHPTVAPNILYRWKREKDDLVPHSNSLRLFDELTRFTGMSQRELNSAIMERKIILDWMVKRNIRSIEEVSKVFKAYYLDPDRVEKQARKNLEPDTLFE